MRSYTKHLCIPRYKREGSWNETETGLQKFSSCGIILLLTMVFFQEYGSCEALAIVARSEL